MDLKTISRLATTFLFLFCGSEAVAQDLIAKQAPIDRKLKTVDSVALQKLIEAEENLSSDLYASSWNNSKVHCYSSNDLPETFKIDLRGFHMPTPSRNVTSRYGYRASFRRMHRGLDIKVYTGDTIYAAFDGKIRIVDYEGSGYGNYIVIRHNNGLETIYGHLSKHLVRVDDNVKAGEPIGLGGNTGRSTGSHLHFETRLLGEAINPELLFDFPNQDVTGDFFVYKRSGNRRLNETLAQAPRHDEPVETETQFAAAPKNDGSHLYKVKQGETLYSIAGKLGVSLDELRKVNRLTGKSGIRPGQILRY